MDRVAGDSLNNEVFSEKALVNVRFLVFGHVYDRLEMASPKLVDSIVECLVKLRDIVNENGLNFSKRAIDSFTPRGTEEQMEGQPDEVQPEEQEAEAE